MARFLFGVLLCFFIISCGSLPKNFEEEPFAMIANEKFIFLKDTALFKSYILKNMSFNKPVFLNKTQIIKQKMIGLRSDDFYFVMWTNAESNLKIAKWLEKKGDKLFFVSSASDAQENFKKHYLLCVGNAGCFPELIATDSSKVWNCTKDLKCLTLPIDSSKASNCRVLKTVILDE